MSKLREARKAAGITQEQLALELNINRATISKYENGTIDIPVPQAKAISRILKINWKELYPEEQPGAAIAADVIKRAGLTLKGEDGEIIHQGDGRKWHKMSDAEAYRAGFLQFHSEEDRIAYFYKQLTDEGRMAAGGYFFQHLDKDTLSKVADYVMSLSENPLYQRPDPPEGNSTPTAEPSPESTDRV